MLYVKNKLPEYGWKTECEGLFSYCGGKGRLLKYILGLIYSEDCETFMELCTGSGIVGMNVSAKHKIVNDLDVELAVIYKALSIEDTADQLLKRMESAEFCIELRDEAKKYWDDNDDEAKKYWDDNEKYHHLADIKYDELVNAAFYSWIIRKTSRIGSDTTTTCKFTEADMRKFINFQQKLIYYYHRLYGAVVWNRGILEILKDLSCGNCHTSGKTVIYIDPPYLPSKKREKNSGNPNTYKNRNNTHIFTADSHVKMLEYADKLSRDKYTIIISGYESNVYDNLLSGKDFGNWTKVFVKELAVGCTNGKAFKNGRPRAEEYFYINYKLDDGCALYQD